MYRLCPPFWTAILDPEGLLCCACACILRRVERVLLRLSCRPTIFITSGEASPSVVRIIPGMWPDRSVRGRGGCCHFLEHVVVSLTGWAGSQVWHVPDRPASLVTCRCCSI
ncbi:hypothetical protein CEXT_220451 [Caerostris extrusa]|uniref:Secreted protein n=1 Tax=Caerostris extrusa TaxID=172846 RepID=A0AAV4PVQ8_CAEEX|nr:hypothetical protein CEXT_220451 [Caerostris extrusa]